MKIYDLYKPFRNELRKMALQPALANVWRYQKLATPSAFIKLQIGFSGSVFKLGSSWNRVGKNEGAMLV